MPAEVESPGSGRKVMISLDEPTFARIDEHIATLRSRGLCGPRTGIRQACRDLIFRGLTTLEDEKE